MRDCPALPIIPPLLDKGAVIVAHDPQSMGEAKEELFDTIAYADNIYSAVQDADAVVLMTEWNEYRNLDLCEIKKLMRGNAFIDLRNVYERDSLEGMGFIYTAVGR